MTAVRIPPAVAPALFCALGACGGGVEPGAAAPAERDPRIASLLAGCTRSDPYDRNVADVVPILVEKLATGERDPLKRAKEELSALGSAAIPEVKRFLEAHYTEAHGIQYLSNALDVLKQSPAPEARELLLRCLEHPGDSVRIAAVQGLRLGHARPEDFDVLLRHLELELPEQRRQVALALHAADAARAEALYLDWIRTGERADLVRYVAPLLSASERDETRRAAAELFPAAGVDVRDCLAAAAARGGDAAALELLRGELAAGGDRRLRAVSAAVEAHLEPLLVEALQGDGDAQVRTVAAAGLARGEPGAQARAALGYGIDDLAPQVRAACLQPLVERGDPAAVDRALAQLSESTASLQEAMTALLRRMPEDPVLAERVLERLLERNALEEFLPLEKRTATLKSIGQVPSAGAARFLRELGVAQGDQRIEHLRAHEWLMIQAANTGDAGRALLQGELAGETDPPRRLDLLWAASAARTDATRTGLVELLDGGTLAPEEVLFVADRLARLGPASEMAGRLKRVANRVEDRPVRIALHCLLWRWY